VFPLRGSPVLLPMYFVVSQNPKTKKELVDLIAVYKSRRDAMISIIREEFPKGVNFSYPEGGLFIWIELPQYINARDLLKKTQEYNVVFVPGDSFCPNGGHENYFRLNFSNMSEDKIICGMRKIIRI